MRCFVTGGAGFIGSYFCHWLLERGHRVTCYDNLLLGRKENIQDLIGGKDFQFLQLDLLEDKDLSRRISGHDLVIHLAGNSDISRGSVQTDLDLNLGVIATYRVLEAMRSVDAKKIVFASSGAVYGECAEKPTREDFGPLVPISFYGASKVAAESLIAAFSHNFEIQSWIFRFANIVGPNMTHGAIYDFKKRLREHPEKLVVLGNGSQRKSYVHVSDCVAGIWWGIEHAKQAVNLFNLAGDGTTDVSSMAAWTAQKVAVPARVEFGQSDRGWKGDVPFTFLNGEKLKRLGWTPRLTSDQAVKNAIEEMWV